MKKKIIIALAAVLLFVTVSGFAVYKTVFGSIGKVDNENVDIVLPDMEDFEADGAANGKELSPDSVLLEKVPLTSDGKLINILLVGQDRRPGEGRQRSDTMILCSYNIETNEVSLISFLRDLYVQIPGGYSDNRLNAPYAFGGFLLLYDTFKENFGITVDGGIEVDFEGFVDLVDLVGGVDIELTQAEAYEVGEDCYAGLNHLDGHKALNYARIRVIDSDFGRTNRQRTVLVKLFEKIKSSNPDTLMKLLKAALSMVTTDMSDAEIMSVAAKLLPKISSLKISTYAVPGEGDFEYASIRGMSVLVPDLPAIRNKLETEYLPIN